MYDKEDFMSNAVKTIGVLTSGGDAPGMNAAILLKQIGRAHV